MKSTFFKITVAAIIAALFSCGTKLSKSEGYEGADPWKGLNKILSQIKAPSFPDKDFVITEYGAVADGKTDCTVAFKKAIETCNTAGGGRVVVPAG
jgi:polygalacturonase